jgi:uncharacterized membrane protein HdeD (DUF308 family)
MWLSTALALVLIALLVPNNSVFAAVLVGALLICVGLIHMGVLLQRRDRAQAAARTTPDRDTGFPG